MQYVPDEGSHHNNNRLHQNANHGRDQNINDRGYQSIHNVGQIGQSAGRDINHFYSTDANCYSRRERLLNAIAGVGASHKAEHQFDRGQCLPGTREEALRSVYDWGSSNDQTSPVCWLSGPAGVGKSAVALTVAESYEIEGRLASSFFFFRSDPKRNDPSALMPFIAHGLTSITPLMRNHIEQRISEDPTILDARLEDQFHELILQPALLWSKQRSMWGFFTDLPGSPVVPNIVVIDGLDECSDEHTQLRILSIIQSGYRQAPHFPLRFLICSRPESWIQEAFEDNPLFQLSKRIVLGDSLAAREDTRKYYRHHFHEIATCRKFGHIPFPCPWPSERDLEILVERTCSQFIFAVTVIKFIMEGFKHPIEQLRVILEKIRPRRPRASPYQQLDTLYEVILSANPDQEEVLDILAALLVLDGHLKTSSTHIELVLGLSTGQLPLTLRAMHSVLVVPSKPEKKIRFHHTSFTEYLRDQARSGQFHINTDTQKLAIARRWFQNLTTSRVQTYTSNQLYGVKTRDFFLKWNAFCLSIPAPTRDLLEHLWNVDLASTYLASRLRETQDWDQVFNGLVLWVQKYNATRISENVDKKETRDYGKAVEANGQCEFEGYSREMDNESDRPDLVGGLVLKLQDYPKCFHLECPPGVSVQNNVMYWVLRDTTRCPNPTYSLLDGSRPRGDIEFYLTDCHCDLSGGNESRHPGHLAYEEGCMQLVKAYISHFQEVIQKLTGAFVRYDYELYIHFAFENFIRSSLLNHFRINTELLSLCQTFFGLAKGCSVMRVHSNDGEKGRKNMLGWIETFPDEFAEAGEALKVQILGLPWERWAQNWEERWVRGSEHY
ncbi:hypothetical protein PM082_003822 [Marasmius tenuissimus]|nr:hypothetical protein PM082_003822 [Marasmius tenuissimus]